MERIKEEKNELQQELEEARRSLVDYEETTHTLRETVRQMEMQPCWEELIDQEHTGEFNT